MLPAAAEFATRGDRKGTNRKGFEWIPLTVAGCDEQARDEGFGQVHVACWCCWEQQAVQGYRLPCSVHQRALRVILLGLARAPSGSVGPCPWLLRMGLTPFEEALATWADLACRSLLPPAER